MDIRITPTSGSTCNISIEVTNDEAHALMEDLLEGGRSNGGAMPVTEVLISHISGHLQDHPAGGHGD